MSAGRRGEASSAISLLGKSLIVLAVTSASGGFRIMKIRMTEGAMTMIALKFSKLKFLSRERGYADLEVLSDKCLEDIGFRLARRDLSSVKPFWLA
jgi:uncharacterized protein YjiS (DUF1127 family)